MYHLFAQALNDKCVGIIRQLLLCFKDYFSDLSQRVVLQGQSSTKKSIQAGVPQGSVLGPLFFLVFIDDFPDIVRCHIRLFANDTTLFTLGNNLEEASAILNDDQSAVSRGPRNGW